MFNNHKCKITNLLSNVCKDQLKEKQKRIAMPCCIINLRIRFIATSLIKKNDPYKNNNKGWEKKCDRKNYYSSCQLSSKLQLLCNLSTNCKL